MDLSLIWTSTTNSELALVHPDFAGGCSHRQRQLGTSGATSNPYQGSTRQILFQSFWPLIMAKSVKIPPSVTYLDQGEAGNQTGTLCGYPLPSADISGIGVRHTLVFLRCQELTDEGYSRLFAECISGLAFCVGVLYSWTNTRRPSEQF